MTRLRQRFELAMERLRSSDWARFEVLASEFLSSEYQDLRTVANPSGDGGRDSELFSPVGSPSVLFQYSVSEDWENKIKKSAYRINQTFPAAIILQYVTNQHIGAKADKLKRKILIDNKIVLDVMDKAWFLERFNSNAQRERAAEALAEEYVDPLLKDRKIIDRVSQILTDTETMAAYLYLGFQLEDDSKEKGLTKLSFEALVRSVLRETDPDHRIKRDIIKQEVRKVLSSHPLETVDKYTDNALNRMAKKIIRHYPQSDEFCLSHDERIRLSGAIAKHESDQLVLKSVIKELIEKYSGVKISIIADELEMMVTRVERIIETYLNTRGEKFASAVTTGKIPGLAHEDLKTIITRDFSICPPKIKGLDYFELIINTINELLCSPFVTTNDYLRTVADTYTLMAFLRETADVQSSIKKIFSYGEIWLDTSIILPLFAESLLGDEDKRFYSKILRATQNAGISLRVITGVVEEVNGHMNRSLACARTTTNSWQGGVPFLLSIYILSGRDMASFPLWISKFKGDIRPEDDLAQYLHEFFQIKSGSLEDEMERADQELKAAVQEIWHITHENRKQRKHYDISDMKVHQLVRHDVENYLGVICKRKKEDSSPLDYSTWWLTLDSQAYRMEASLRNRINGAVPSSPALTLDFLSNYLTFGPLRRLQGAYEDKLPIFIDKTFVDYIPPELLDVAKRIREEIGDVPEYIVRRKVRDALETERRRIGRLTEGGTALMQQKIEAAFSDIPLED